MYALSTVQYACIVYVYQFIYLIRELHRVDVPRHHPVDPLGLPVGQAGLTVAKPALGAGAAEPAGKVHALPARVAEAAAAGGAAAGRTGVEACSCGMLLMSRFLSF